MRLLLLATLFAATTGCTDLAIGRKCGVNSDAGITGPQLSRPALECPSRLCLLQVGQESNPPRGTCTSTCDSNDDCADAVTSKDGTMGQCPGGFVCTVATPTGEFACKKVCVCRDDVVCGFNSDVDGGAITPPSCLAAGESAPNYACP